jgi:osmotically inducible lipoprotein OsmB
MRKTLIGIAVIATLSFSSAANAGPSDSTVSGAAIGAGTGLLVAGPVGAVAGGLIGATVGGPTGRPHRRCWTEFNGARRCKYYRW